MAISIGKLSAILSLNSTQFTRGLTRARKRLGAFGRRIGGAIKRIGAYGAALTGVAGAAGLVLMTKRSLEAMDTTGKLAFRINASTKALTGMQFAAQQTGASTEAFNKGIEMMTRRLGEVQMGTGEAVDALKLLGMNAEELAGLKAEKAFYKIADATKALENQSLKAAVAAKMFGRAGVELVTMLDLGSAGLDEMQRTAEKLGITYDDLAAVKAAMTIDALNRLKQMLTGVALTISQQLMPFIMAVSNKMVAMGTSGEGMGTKVLGAVKGVMLGIAKLGDTISLLKGVWLTMKAVAIISLAMIVDMVDAMMQGIIKAINVLPGVEVAYTGITKTVTALKKAADAAHAESIGAFAAYETGEAGTAIRKFFADIEQGMATTAEDIADKMKKPPGDPFGAEELTKKFSDLQNAAGRIFDQTRTPMEKFKKDLETLKEVFTAGLIDEDTYRRDIERIQKTVAGSTSVADEKTGSFAQIVRGRTAFGGAKRKEKVPIEGDPKQTELLQAIAQALQAGVPARVAA